MIVIVLMFSMSGTSVQLAAQESEYDSDKTENNQPAGGSPDAQTQQEAEKDQHLPLIDVTAPGVRKVEVHYSQLGPRDTIIFYTIPKHRAILRMDISGSKPSGQITASLYTFATGTDTEQLNKWVNNQHSDALYADAPTHIEKLLLPANNYKLISRTKTKNTQSDWPGGRFDEYKLAFLYKNCTIKNHFRIKGFRVETTLFTPSPKPRDTDKN